MSAYKYAEDPSKLWIGLFYEAQTPTLEDKLNRVMDVARQTKGKMEKDALSEAVSDLTGPVR